jgi:hypothetical protein
MMETRYVAYGLALHSTFELPGMRPTGVEGLPALALELVSPAELLDVWSGADGPPAWRGRLSDGVDLSIERGRDGDTLLVHGSHASHRLDASMQTLAVSPRCPGPAWQRALLTKVLPIVSIMRGYEALHAGAVDSPWGAVAVAAPTGTGKTTLALELMRRGWPLLSDDVLALAATPHGVVAFPGVPQMNVSRTAPEVGRTLAQLADERWIAVRDAAREPCPVCAIVLLERGRGSALELRVLPSSPLPLTPYMLGLPDELAREAGRFELYADLMGQATLMRLRCPDSVHPRDLADAIERALGDVGGAHGPALQAASVLTAGSAR